jgi:hypothetical protein
VDLVADHRPTEPTDQVEASTLWSAATRRRFGLRWLDTALVCGGLTPHSLKTPN